MAAHFGDAARQGTACSLQHPSRNPQRLQHMSPMTGSGRDYWRRLQELADRPEFAEIVEREAPRFRAALDGLDRRRFLQIMAAPMVLAALSGCGQEADPRQIVPFVEQPP